MEDGAKSNSGEGGTKFNPCNLIVNYLPQSLTDDEFRSLFESIGNVKASKIIRERGTQTSYGFGFIEYEDEALASRAIEVLNGLQLQNKRIKVAYSRQGENIKGSNLYVHNLPKTMSAKDLERLFSQFGHIVQTRVLTHPNNGLSRGVGFVLFSTKDEATKAMTEMDGTMPPGFTQSIGVKNAEENKKKIQPVLQYPVVMNPMAMGLSRPLRQIGATGLPGARLRTAGPLGMFGQPGSLLPSGPMGGPFGVGAAVGPMGGTFGTGYHGTVGGGPLRTAAIRQRYDPLACFSSQPPAMAIQNGGGVHNAVVGGNPPVLFIYNIGPDTDERALWQLVSPFGAIQKVNVVRDHEKKQGKGYGFVTMFDYQEAIVAIQSLNGAMFNEKELQVSLKAPK